MMARKYQLKRRAERQAETRRRIVEATVELHTTLGPAHTTMLAIAERAGVQRPTIYRYFPTPKDLSSACSSHLCSQNPPPNPEPWLKIADPEARLRQGLTELYEYYSRHELGMWKILRDLEDKPEFAAVRSPPRCPPRACSPSPRRRLARSRPATKASHRCTRARGRFFRVAIAPPSATVERSGGGDDDRLGPKRRSKAYCQTMKVGSGSVASHPDIRDAPGPSTIPHLAAFWARGPDAPIIRSPASAAARSLRAATMQPRRRAGC